MLNSFKLKFKKIFGKRSYQDIHPDEIFLDSKNLPEFNLHQFEGRIEKPISPRTFIFFGILSLLILIAFIGRLFDLQITEGAAYAEKSENNILRQTIIFAARGIIEDRNGEQLAWNNTSTATDTDSVDDFPVRNYITDQGFGHLLGFIKYPAKDSSGNFYRQDYEPQDGVELFLNDELSGKNGLKITETDVSGKTVSESVIDKPVDGDKITLSIDSRIQKKMYDQIKETADKQGFQGGAGVLMNVDTGEILAMTSYPEYEPQVMTDGSSTDAIKAYSENPNRPFLNRITSGLYAPGSVVKPFLAFASLEEGIITPEKQIVTNGKLVIPNPYFPDQPSIFLDWRNNGVLDIRHAIAQSSDVFFYELGGGFGDQPGLGISRIDQYLKMFGFGEPTGIDVVNEQSGNIPTPEWKEKVFNEPWRLGDTYHTAIGQYGTQVTPIQEVRAIAAIANGGTLVTPTFVKQATSTPGQAIAGKKVPIKNFYDLQVVREGMRLSILEGTSKGLDMGDLVHLAGKTGTAEIGVKKDTVNSWTTGFFPYENPKYVYMIVMEKGPVHNLIGGTYVMRQVLDWMAQNTPEYLK